ncbi:MAG: glycosyltransferase family 2 protein [Prevotellaceae bacterium]|jgi:GT2 family glycosyltransferase|nr:glycosyltransferase family 2 protein [Prevotellaceae bacterium]
MKTKTAIVILNWNGRQFLSQFLPSLVRYTTMPDVALVVADNGSTDDSAAFVQHTFPQIRWIGLDTNYGFTGGYNRALSQVEADYYVLLNSDVEVTENWLQPLLSLMDSCPAAAVCAPKIRSFVRRHYFEYAGAAGGFIDRYGYPFCRGRILHHIEEDTGQYDTTRAVFWVGGACLLVRAALYHRLGGLDERFFAHMEEIDFCWRVKQLGYEVVCCPQSVVYHVGGGTLPAETPFKLYLNYRNSLFMLYKNLPDRIRFRILAARLLLDGASAAIYGLQGKWSFVAAVWKAHIHFWQRRKQIRAQSLPEHNNTVSEIYQGSILWRFYVKRKAGLRRLLSEL